MNVFEAARQIDCISAAERLGMLVKRSGSKAYARCFFHAENTPSLCLYSGNKGFYCFGCHEHGDVICLYSQALKLPLLAAAKHICTDFGLAYNEPGKKIRKGTLPQKTAQRMDAWTVANKLVAWRERQVDDFLAQLRTAEAAMQQIEEKLVAERLPVENSLDDPCWMEALVMKVSMQDKIDELSGLSIPEILQWIKVEENDRGRNAKPRKTTG
jgi:DNA primase